MITTLEPHDVVRAWKDEDYREDLGLELSDHPAGDIDLMPVALDAPSDPSISSYDMICMSIINNCFTSWPYICSTKLCHNELAESRN